MTDTEYMRLALREARKASDAGEIPIGAVLVYWDSVIAADHNRRESDRDPTAHAEILALRMGALRLGRWRLTECTLYVTIEPCAMCAGAVMNARIARLVYGSEDAKAGGVDSHFHICEGTAMDHRIAVTRGILRADCESLLIAHFQSRRHL